MAVLVAFVNAVEGRLLLFHVFIFFSLPLLFQVLSPHLQHVFWVPERVIVGKSFCVGRAEAKSHDGTNVELRINFNGAVEALCNLLANAEPNAVPTLIHFPIRLIIRSKEGLEKIGLVLFAHADAAVDHSDLHHKLVLLGVYAAFDLDVDLGILVGEFNRILQQIDDDLLNA